MSVFIYSVCVCLSMCVCVKMYVCLRWPISTQPNRIYLHNTIQTIDPTHAWQRTHLHMLLLAPLLLTHNQAVLLLPLLLLFPAALPPRPPHRPPHLQRLKMSLTRNHAHNPSQTLVSVNYP